MNLSSEDLAKFWQRVDRNGPAPSHVSDIGPCFVWKGCVVRRYGQITLHNEKYRAHRLAWFIEYGRWPEPQALHRCDNPLCVRVSHLFEGTGRENARDRVRKRRFIGQAHPGSVLSDDQVEEIRRVHRETGRTREIAERFGVSRRYIQLIARGQYRSSRAALTLPAEQRPEVKP